eukprot:1159047-Pelagomonas_calceolata.AAC.9
MEPSPGTNKCDVLTHTQVHTHNTSSSLGEKRQARTLFVTASSPSKNQELILQEVRRLKPDHAHNASHSPKPVTKTKGHARKCAQQKVRRLNPDHAHSASHSPKPATKTKGHAHKRAQQKVRHPKKSRPCTQCLALTKASDGNQGTRAQTCSAESEASKTRPCTPASHSPRPARGAEAWLAGGNRAAPALPSARRDLRPP